MFCLVYWVVVAVPVVTLNFSIIFKRLLSFGEFGGKSFAANRILLPGSVVNRNFAVADRPAAFAASGALAIAVPPIRNPASLFRRHSYLL
ncbi:hypothetical protein CAT32_00230 [Acinetobacter baumannii]|nr:hypothetical protein [Acinetobacter baumannii]OTU73293.1 hypothetical protein CAT32_00230 [Acinetobacter baumannii]